MKDHVSEHFADLEKSCFQTAPIFLNIQLAEFPDQRRALNISEIISRKVRQASCYINLCDLDGITISYKYIEALKNIDRGCELLQSPAPSSGELIGIAMTVPVIRKGKLKSHIVLNAEYVLALENEKSEFYSEALHTLLHECAHVDVTHNLNNSFPFLLTRPPADNLRIAFRWQIILACWEEYAACLISAPSGRGSKERYEQAFLVVLEQTLTTLNCKIQLYRLNGNLEELIINVYKVCGELMKISSYHIGNLNGLNVSIDEVPRTYNALRSSWFLPYFLRLSCALSDLKNNYGDWFAKTDFELIGDIADEILLENGVYIRDLDDGFIYVNVDSSSSSCEVRP